MFALACLVNVGLWVALLVGFAGSSEFVIIRYTIYFGISALGPWYRVLSIPLLGLVVILLHVVIAAQSYVRDRFVSRSVALAALVINLALTVAAAFILYVN